MKSSIRLWLVRTRFRCFDVINVFSCVLCWSMASKCGDSVQTDVTIILITYNQEQTVEKCLESIFKQKTNLRVDVLVCDDASVDATQLLITNYLANVDTQFGVRVVFHERNLGNRGNTNADFGLREASGNFVTILNGDDFLMCDNHIENSHQALLQMVDCAAVTSGHVKVRSHDGVIIETCVSGYSKSFRTLADLEFYPLLGASMWKRDIIFSVPDELIPYLTDTMLWHFIAKQGQCVALPYVSLCYNITGVGVHTSLSMYQAIVSHINLYKKLVEHAYSDYNRDQLRFWLWWAIEDCSERGDLGEIKSYSVQLADLYGVRNPTGVKIYVKYRLISLFPVLLVAYKKMALLSPGKGHAKQTA